MIQLQCSGICRPAKAMMITLDQVWTSLQVERLNRIITPYNGFLPPWKPAGRNRKYIPETKDNIPLKNRPISKRKLLRV
jgi:hypothetical protein